MIIVSFLVFIIMLVWLVGSVLTAVIGLSLAFESLELFLLGCVGAFSLVCWYQVLVWGKPWFDVLAQAWL